MNNCMYIILLLIENQLQRSSRLSPIVNNAKIFENRTYESCSTTLLYSNISK